jgi:integrase
MSAIENVKDFTGANTNAKLVRAISSLVRRARLDYDAFRRVCAQMRKEIGLRRPRRSRRLPRILPESSLRRFYQEIDRAGNLQHQIMLRLLFYTAVRLSELVNIVVHDIDLDGCKIFIERGKGDKDRYILFPETLRLILKSHLAAHPDNRYRCGLICRAASD